MSLHISLKISNIYLIFPTPAAKKGNEGPISHLRFHYPINEISQINKDIKYKKEILGKPINRFVHNICKI